MIGSVRGTVIERSATGEVLVEVGGVGYRCLVPLGAIPALAPSSQAFLFTHLHVREDAMTLYGFPTRDERDTFEVLISASGVGPKLGLAMLSVHPPSALRRCVADDDLDCAVPRPRGRQAHRAEADDRAEEPPRRPGPRPRRARAASPARRARAEVRAALTELGYGPEEVRVALNDLPADGTIGDLLRAALKRLAVKA